MAAGTSRSIFVNLAVKDLDRSVDFFTKLGFRFNAQFTDESATCMVISDHAYVMLLVHDRFKDFTKKQIVDSTTHTEVLVALSAESREAVDAMVNAALAAGGSPANDPQDHGFMYGWSFQDPDGHIWEVMWMDPAFVQPQ
ncbi:MAG TPA: VOC family protein [Longimicrobium sp.]|uniref:VOC family protein n=1 Tax=Longimicrobium sp. TaxID=2029185 RepID=UPI002ED9E9BA